MRNSGLISATTGDITLTGHQIRQDGVLVASTDIGARGAIHLLNRASDASGSVTLGAGSVTAVLLEPSAVTGLEGQRTAALKTLDGLANNNTAGVFDNLSTVADRPDLPRIEVVSGNLASFLDGSTTLATGGQIAVSARRQTLLDAGARLDVAGAIGVRLAMESNNLKIDVQGNEQRDAPVNRDSKLLNNSEIWIDRRTLVKVPGGANGYAGERWYTGGGLLEVGGYLATSGRTASEWLAQGGTATFTGGALVTRAGSDINLSGGTLDVQDGYIRQSWLRGADGRLYDVSRAPGDLLYTGLYKGFEQVHQRWGDKATRVFYNPLIGPRTRFENGYTVGRDAGALIVSTGQARLEGGVTGEVYQGPRQTDAPQWDMDGYLQSQTTVARRGRLIVGSYLPRYDADSGQVNWALAALAGKVSIGSGPAADGEIRLDAAWLNAVNPGQLTVAAKERIAVEQALGFAPGAGVLLYAPQVDIQAGIAAQGGRIQAGNVLRQVNDRGAIEDVLVRPATGKPAGVTLAAGATLDVSGLWTNAALDPAASPGLAPQRRTGGAAQQRQHRARPGQPGGRERRGRHPERRQGPGRPGRRSAAGGRIGGVARRAGAGRRAGRARRGRRRQADPAGQPDPRGARRAARPGRARRRVGAGGQRLRAGLLAIRTDRHARPGSRRRRAAARLDAAAAPGAGRRRRDGQDAGPAALDAAALPGRRGQERADAAQGRQPDPAERHAADRAERAVPRRPDAGGRFAGGGRPGPAHQSGRHRPDHAERHAAGLVGPHRGDRAARHDHGRDDGDRLRPLTLGRRTRRAGRGRARPRRSTSRASPTACCRMAAASRWAAWSTSPRATWPRRTCSSCCGRAAGWTHPAPPPACWPTARRWPPPAPAG